MPMRLLSVMITPDPAAVPYGAELTCIELMKSLTSIGVKVFTLERRPAFGRKRKVNFASFELPNPVFSKGFSTLRVTAIAIGLSLRLNCDVIYAYGDYVEESFLPAFLASLFTHKKLVTSVLDEAKSNTDQMNIVQLLRYRIRKGSNLRRVFKYVSFNVARRVAFRNSCVALTATNHLAIYAKRTLHARKVSVIGRGLAEEWFLPAAAAKRFDAIFVGRVDYQKGIDILLGAWKQVVRARPGSKLLVVGGGNVPEAKLECERMGISGDVTFTGYVSETNALRDLLASSRVFVLPSRSEGFGRVVTEALASGLPCVLSDLPVFREIFSEIAVLVPTDDIAGFSQAILKLLMDEKNSQEIGSRGLELVRQMSWGEAAKRMLQAISPQ